MSACQRIRIGGTVSGSAISGGTLIETHGMNLLSWDGIHGYPGRVGSDSLPVGGDGASRNASKLYRPRLLTLALVVYNRDADNLITLADAETHLFDNMDTILGLIAGSDETVILERDMPDGTTRWIEFEATQPASFNRGPIFGYPHASYAMILPVVCWWPFWQTKIQTTTAFATGFTPAGNAPHSPILSFTSNGRVTHVESAEYVEITGATFGNPVTVDCQKRTVQQNGLNVDGYFTHSGPRWLRFTAGVAATFVATATGDFLRRGQWL